MDNEIQPDKLYATTLQTIGAVAKLPVVRVDREAFLRKHFAGSPHLNVILERGPQAVYSAKSLRTKASSIIKNSAAKSSAASFATGLPGNPAVMIAAGGADVAQYFGFAINLAQQIAYLFGEDELFDGGGQLSEAAQIRVSRRRESHPPALAEPGVNLSAHRAPIVQPSGRTPKRQWANRPGWRRATSAINLRALPGRRRSRLYFFMAHRTRMSLRWRKTGYNMDL